MTHPSSHQRRQFLQLCGLAGVGLCLPGCTSGLSSSVEKGLSQHWPPYSSSLIIDGLGGVFEAGGEDISTEQLALFRQSGISAVNVTVPYPGDNYQVTQDKIRHTLNTIHRYPQHFMLINRTDDILQAKMQQKLGIIMGFQSMEMFDGKVNAISEFASMGVKVMQLSYNGPSPFGNGGLVQSNQGLSELGRLGIQEMEQHRVLVDLSHSNQQTVVDGILAARRPLTISHTGCNHIYRHPRNNDDRELRAVAEKGGVVGIYLMPFLEGGDGEITANALIKHLQHAIQVCGEDHVSIGSDQGVLPVNDTPAYREAIRQEVERRIKAGISAPGETPNRPPFIPQLNQINRMELIGWHLHKAGHSDDRIEKILGTNLLQLYGRVW